MRDRNLWLISRSLILLFQIPFVIMIFGRIKSHQSIDSIASARSAVPTNTVVAMPPYPPRPGFQDCRIITDRTNWWVQTWTGFKWFTFSPSQPSKSNALEWIESAAPIYKKFGWAPLNFPQ